MLVEEYGCNIGWLSDSEGRIILCVLHSGKLWARFPPFFGPTSEKYPREIWQNYLFQLWYSGNWLIGEWIYNVNWEVHKWWEDSLWPPPLRDWCKVTSNTNCKDLFLLSNSCLGLYQHWMMTTQTWSPVKCQQIVFFFIRICLNMYFFMRICMGLPKIQI